MAISERIFRILYSQPSLLPNSWMLPKKQKTGERRAVADHPSFRQLQSSGFSCKLFSNSSIASG
jgi:hypothetical protein